MTDPLQPFDLSPSRKKSLWIVLFVLFCLRLIAIFVVPFIDTTEARYAEIARKMVETNDWITPQFDYGVPFWGKPPLHTWISAAGMKLFGVGEFGGRVFIFASSIGVLIVLYRWAKGVRGENFAMVGTVIVASTVVFFIASAMVMTDMAMTLGVCISMAAFWDSLSNPQRKRTAGYLFFVGLAIGLMAKGPVAFVLTAMPIGLWVIIGNRWKATWQNIPWISGTLLMLLLTLPWYVAAELKTPGFIKYFLVGEHFQRFVDSGWKGDLYGSGHAEPRGTIWIYWLLMLLPWTPFLLAPLCRFRAVFAGFRKDESGWSSYLLIWALSPIMLFTVATNIIPSYALTGIPAASFLAVQIWVLSAHGGGVPSQGVVRFFKISLGFAFILFACVPLYYGRVNTLKPPKTQKWLVEKVENLRETETGEIYCWRDKTYSIQFYTAGKARLIENVEELDIMLSNESQDYLSVPTGQVVTIPPKIADKLKNEGIFGRYTLFAEKNIQSTRGDK